jgi:prepilin-type N-terminal cleavage/methylation domain-containing protein
MRRETKLGNDGFTLIELLIVIVILGVLSTVTAFAVRGIADQGQRSSCASEIDNLVRVEEHHRVLHGSYAAEADLVSNQMIVADSSMYDITLAVDQTYTISPAAGSSCTATATGGGTTSAGPVIPVGPDRTTYAIAVGTTSFGTFHLNPGSYQVTPSSGAPNEVVIFGRSNGLLDWHDMINGAQPNTRRVTFINLDNTTDASIRYAISQSRNNGETTVAYYPSDDPGGAAFNVISAEWAANPDPDDLTLEPLVALPASGTTLLQLLNSLG